MKKIVLLFTLLFTFSMPVFAKRNITFKIYAGPALSQRIGPKVKLAGYDRDGVNNSRVLDLKDYKNDGLGPEYKLCVVLDWLELGYLQSTYKAKGTGKGESSNGEIEFTTSSLETMLYLLSGKIRDGFQLSLGGGVGGVTVTYKDDNIDFIALGKEWHLRGTVVYNMTRTWGAYTSYFSQKVTMVTRDDYTNTYLAIGLVYSF